MMFRKKLILAMFGATISLGLAGCGSDSDGNSTTGLAGLNETKADDVAQDSGTDAQDGSADASTGDDTTGSSVNNAHTIVLTYPITESVENLGGGVYRRVGKAIVTDNEGNPVPDGTEIYFSVIDSVIVKGTITSANGDSITGSVLTDIDPMLADGSLTTFETAYVTRNEAIHSIKAGDHLYLKGENPSDDANSIENADAEDKNRIISSDEGAISGNTLKVSEDYVSSYPNSVYTSGVTDYVVGASLLGAKILGKTYDDTGAAQLNNVGFSITQNGIAEFVVDYPANRRELNSGCNGNSIIDERSLPLGSARVLVVASAGSQAITLDDRFCFAPISPFIVAHDFNPVIDAGAVDASEFIIPVEVEDANNVNVPYAAVDIHSAPSSQLVDIIEAELVDVLGNPTSYTDREGRVFVYLKIKADAKATSSDTATISVESGEGGTDISVVVLAKPSEENALTISPSVAITKIAGASVKTSGMDLSLTDSNGNESKTVYARVNYTTNTGDLIVSLDADYDAVKDRYSYTTNADGEFESLVTVTGGADGDAAEVVYFYGPLEVKATVNILP